MVVYILDRLLLLFIILIIVIANTNYFNEKLNQFPKFKGLIKNGFSTGKALSLKQLYEEFSLKRTSNKLILIFLIILLFVRIDNQFHIDVLLYIFLCCIAGIKIRNSFKSLYFRSLALYFLSLGFFVSLIFTSKMILEDFSNYTFSFISFLKITLLNLIILTLLYVQSLKEKGKFLPILLIVIYSLWIPFVFYLHLGGGLLIYEYPNLKNMKFDLTNDFHANILGGWESMFAIIYYGISEVAQLNAFKVIPMNENVSGANIKVVYLKLLGLVFNIFYFSSIFTLITSLLQKKRYNVDK